MVLPPQGEPASYALRYLTFSQNLLWPMPPDNWFGVSWSLAVEEWFYLLFSSVLLMAAVLWPRKSVAVTCALFLLLPLLCRVVYASGVLDPDGGLRKIVAYRLDAITYGVTVAALTRFRPRFVSRWSTMMLLGGSGLGATGCWFLFRLPVPELRPFMLSLIPLGFSLCLPAALKIPTPTHLVHVAVTWLSTRSYALYIVHLSVLELAFRAIVQNSIPVALGLFFFVFWPVLLAELSYRFLEMPLLRLRPT
jgi:peptidoglycan/LPS O-acetylase OafA/YrhL